MEKQEDEYGRVFKQLDGDKDGRISGRELQKCVEAIGWQLSVAEAETGVEMLDFDGDGLVGLEDIVRFVEGGEEEAKLNDLKKAFQMYEMEDECGRACSCITPQSLQRMLSRLGESKTIDECKCMIAKFDLNGDGVLSFEEFKVMMS